MVWSALHDLATLPWKLTDAFAPRTPKGAFDLTHEMLAQGKTR